MSKCHGHEPCSNHKEIFITERHIQALWLEQKYLSGLKTSSGEEIVVRSPGIWNLGPGPDFQKAHVIIGGVEKHGSIELHLSEESWFHHHHHKDPHYNDVILHVALWTPIHSKPIENQRGSFLTKLWLEPFLTIPIAKIAQSIDLDLYPYKQFVGAGRCAEGVFRSMSDRDATELFEDAADKRMLHKAWFLQYGDTSESDSAAAGIAKAAGYKNNATLFLDLFIELGKRQLPSEEDRIAWLLGKTGFFSDQLRKKWKKSAYYGQLCDVWDARYRDRSETITLPVLTQIRPFNHPIRRLVLLAKMAADRSLSRLFERLKSLWNSSWLQASKKNKWGGFLKQVNELIPSYEDEYWNTHFLFEEGTASEHLSLIGGDLRSSIVINVLLPLLRASLPEDGGDGGEQVAALKECYRTIKAPAAGKTKYLVHRFFGDSPKGELLKQAYNVQGAYQVHYDYCIHYEASCEGCPFVDLHRQR